MPRRFYYITDAFFFVFFLFALQRYDSFPLYARFFMCPKAVCQNIIHNSV